MGDTRQIQTAVLAHPESDDPVVCPTDAEELDEFRVEYFGVSFWCGVLLGGCGGQLLTRRGNVRVSHFAHFPDPEGLLPECGRRSRGVASADHLYVRAATQAWLRGQGHTPRYRYIDRDQAPVGSLVEIEVGGHTLLVHMDRTTPPDWDAQGAGEVILGSGVPIDRGTLGRRGYVHRVRFVSEGTRRVMTLGTELPHVGTDWGFDLTDCTVDEHGRLITPVLTRHRAARAAKKRAPASRPRDTKTQGRVQIGALTRDIYTAVREKTTTAVKRLQQTAQLQVPRCEGQALEYLQRAIDHASNWRDHENKLMDQQYQAHHRFFTALEGAVRRGHVDAVSTLMSKVASPLERNDTSEHEMGILQAADALLGQAARQRQQRDARRAAAAREREARRTTQAHARPSRRAATAREREVQAQEQKARNRARGQVQRITGRLRREELSAVQQKQLVEEMQVAAEQAGNLLSAAEKRKVDQWVERLATPEEGQDAVEQTPPPALDRPAAAPPRVQPRQEAITEPTKSPARLGSVAAAVRGALKKAARERTTTSWKRLQHQLGSALPSLSTDERVRVLIQVDQSTAADEPLLSSLLAAGDPHFAYQYYRRILTALGLDAPDDDEDLRDVVEADAERVFTDWRFR
ncbi:hypothetical protein [Streptomyces youssoufiensis]